MACLPQGPRSCGRERPGPSAEAAAPRALGGRGGSQGLREGTSGARKLLFCHQEIALLSLSLGSRLLINFERPGL